MIKRLVIVLLFVVLATPAAAQSPFTFQFVSESLADHSFGTVDLVDFDLDGDLDVFLSGNEGLATSAIPAARLFSFDRRSIVFVTDTVFYPSVDYAELANSVEGLWLSDSEWADLNGDGYLDLFLTGTTNTSSPFTGRVDHYLNTGGSGLSPVALPAVPVVGGSIASGDIDNDGDADIVVTGRDGEVSRTVLLEQDDVGFLISSTTFPGFAFGEVVIADLDTDEDLDIVLSGIDESGELKISIHYNSGLGVFDTPAVELRGLAFSDIDLADLDSDGDLDIAVTGGRLSPGVYDGETIIYRNNGGSFSEANIDLAGVVNGSLQWVDFNSDGILDIAISGGASVADSKLLHRFYVGTGSSYRHATNLPAVFPGHASYGDYDGDHDIDILVGGFDERFNNNTYLYENQQRLPNDAPSEPSNLASSVSGGSVNLSWAASTDDTTPASALTYELRVGTSAGGADVVASIASGDGSFRSIGKGGNVSHNLSWFLTDLPNGTYHWSVQAVDNSLIGSAFATEATFEVTASNAVKTGLDEVADATGELLSSPYPNPFSESITIEYERPAVGPFKLGFYDVVGSLVAEIDLTDAPVGQGSCLWMGRDSAGRSLANGVYFLVADGNAKRVTRKLTLLR